tara:strand:+ start:365 stop:649 length:285 start_codon:yes stop_codon:yes gene_type:complete
VNKNNLDQKLRYNDGGNVHMDFHGATNTTIEFIINKYGIDTMNDIFKKVGNDVYKDIKDHIKKGNIKMLANIGNIFLIGKMLIIIFLLMMKKLF